MFADDKPCHKAMAYQKGDAHSNIVIFINIGKCFFGLKSFSRSVCCGNVQLFVYIYQITKYLNDNDNESSKQSYRTKEQVPAFI